MPRDYKERFKLPRKTLFLLMTRPPKFSSVASTVPRMLCPLTVTQEIFVPRGRVALRFLLAIPDPSTQAA